MVEDDGATYLHLGFSGSLRDFDGTATDNDPVSGNTRAPIPFSGTLGSFSAAADDGWQAGFEAAFVTGPMTFKGEYAQQHIDVRGGDGATFDAWSVEAGYWLTGEGTPYNKEAGAFGRTAPKQNYGDGEGTGAWQLALRFDTMDLDDESVVGEEVDSWTLGVNWWLNPNTRIALNYVRADYDNLDEDVDALAIRFQWDF
jgi:phosphate-selective porin OprO/OprP